MEHHAQSVEDHLIEGLSFKLRPGSSYVNSRRNSTFYPAGSNYYSPTGTKVIRIPLSGDTWLDPTTVKVAFDLVNEEANDHILYPVGGAHVFFRRLRIMAGGALVEDVDEFGRLSQMFSVLQPKNKRLNDFVESGSDILDKVYSVAGGSTQTLIFTPMSGLLNQDKYLPLRYCNIVLELELVNNMLDSVLTSGYTIKKEAINAAADLVLNGANCSQTWHLQNVRMLCDTVQLDNELDNQFAQHLLSGKTMPIQFTSYTTQKQSITNSQPSLNISRALTRLKDVFLTFDNEAADRLNYKSANSFKHPDGNKNSVQFHMTIGSQVYPDFPAKSSAELFYMLKKALGVQDSSFYDIDVDIESYHGNGADEKRRFIIGHNLEKVINSNFTGISTKAGDLITINLQGLNNTSHVYVHLHYDGILNIRDIGCEVLD